MKPKFSLEDVSELAADFKRHIEENPPPREEEIKSTGKPVPPEMIKALIKLSEEALPVAIKNGKKLEAITYCTIILTCKFILGEIKELDFELLRNKVEEMT